MVIRGGYLGSIRGSVSVGDWNVSRLQFSASWERGRPSTHGIHRGSRSGDNVSNHLSRHCSGPVIGRLVSVRITHITFRKGCITFAMWHSVQAERRRNGFRAASMGIGVSAEERKRSDAIETRSRRKKGTLMTSSYCPSQLLHGVCDEAEITRVR